jgi:superfamily I DNA/RNA helicase/Zn-dependent peptidase ImmA (M78 family)/CRISPR/Cas system-associated exonuclease Cas4 (RecB family)
MNIQLRTIAETAARLVLQSFREEHPDWQKDCTPLDAIVPWLGLYVETFHAEDYPPGTYGFTDADEDEHLIWLRRDLPENFRRFTLAHELGHALLHCRGTQRIQDLLEMLEAQMPANVARPSRNDPCNETDVQENMTGLLDQGQFEEALGIGHSYDPRSQRELAANVFAAELLMPLDRLRTLYLDEHILPNTLATHFGVSSTAMLNRLAGLLKRPEHAQLHDEHDQAVPVELGQSQDTPGATSQSRSTDTRAASAKKAYDEFQQAAIQAPTPALIVAGPGSGKTSTLIGRTEYLVHTLGIEPQHILALTFSRKATLEMEERLRQALGDPLPKVSTFHAFCADLLRKHGSQVGLHEDFTLIDEAEGYFLLRQQANALRLRHYQKLQAPAYYFPDMLKAISRAKDELVSPEKYAELARRMKEQAHNEETLQEAKKALEIAHVYALYQQALQRRGDSDFGGLLMLTVELFQRYPEILREQQQLYQHVLVDEFQDVNRASGVLLRELASATHNVWVVGDANQAIYSFRGASPANISQFEQDFPGAVILPLSRNYRSRPDLVAIAETFRCQQLEPGQEAGKNQPVRHPQPETVVTLAKASDEACELAGLVQDIRRKHASGYAYKDIVILCRTRSQAKKITRTLAVEGLPVIERGGMLEQEHIKDVLSILLLLTNSSGMGLLRTSRQTKFYLSQQDIETLLMAAYTQKTSPMALISSGEIPLTVSRTGRRVLEQLGETLQTLQYAPDTWSLLAQYMLVETTQVRDLLADEQNKQHSTILADYDRLLSLAHHYDQQLQRNETPPTLIKRIKGFIEYLSLLVLLRQDGDNRQNTEEDKAESADIIRVMTVHASKGLEFPVVYMPGLTKRRFPLPSKASPVTAPDGMLPAESSGKNAHESGESCLFYVGITRARDQLVLSYSERYGKQQYQRSPYLDALETGLPEERITKLIWNPRSVDITPATEQEKADVSLVSSQPSNEFVNAMRPDQLSATAIEAYQRCPRQYAYSNIYHFQPDADGYQLFWQATQKTVEELHKQMQEQGENSGPTQQEVLELYTRHWQELGGHTSPFAMIYETHGHEIVETVHRQLTTQEEVQWNIRQNLDVDIAGRQVRVTVDRIEYSTQSEPRKFVRTRFGARKEKPSAELRELFYTLAYRQQHAGQPVELHSHNLSTGELHPVKLTAKKEQSLHQEAVQSIEGLENNAYPAQPAEPYRCPACPFFLICPA